jgi:hypothetical protein
MSVESKLQFPARAGLPFRLCNNFVYCLVNILVQDYGVTVAWCHVLGCLPSVRQKERDVLELSENSNKVVSQSLKNVSYVNT